MENATNPSSPIFDSQQQPLPNATASLVLGIISLPGCCFYGVTGLILGILAIVLAIKDEKLYRLNPSAYTISSYNNTRAGKICGIIGIVLSSLYVAFIVIFIAMFGMAVLSNPQALQEALNNMQH
jgi:hypothetical protein